MVEQSELQSSAQLESGRGEDCVDELECGLEGVFCQQPDQPGGDEEVQECLSVVVHALYSAEVLARGVVSGLAADVVGERVRGSGWISGRGEPGRPWRV